MGITIAKFLLFTSVLVGSSALNFTPSLANECFEEQFVPAHMECDGNNTNSADFATGCRSVPDATIQVSVECSAQWYNLATPNLIGLHGMSGGRDQAFCNSFGKQAAKIGGQNCASGRYRPTSGQGWEDIEYIWGQTGAANVGGNYIKMKSLRYGPDMSWAETVPFTQYCSNNISSHDLNRNGTGPVEYIVAIACE